MSTPKTPVVLNDTEQTPEILASAIRDVSAAAKKLLGGPLTRRAIAVLIRDHLGSGAIGLAVILDVLDAAVELEKKYTIKTVKVTK